MANKQHIDEFVKENLDNFELNSVPNNWTQISKSLPKGGISRLSIGLLSIASIAVVTLITLLVINNNSTPNNNLPISDTSDSINTQTLDSEINSVEIAAEDIIIEPVEEYPIVVSENIIAEENTDSCITIYHPEVIILSKKNDNYDNYDDYDYSPYDMDLDDKSYLKGSQYSNGVRCDTIH